MLENLNDMQKEAVLATEGPVLVLAGAGSGKTTVLVNRIAYMIEKKNISPYSILAITFTNKAANEMKERIGALLGETAKNMWVGTFHSVCVKILRTCIDLLGYNRDFVIYDSADAKTLMKECLKELELDDRTFPVRNVLSIISGAKNDMLDPATFENVYRNNYRMGVIARLYRLYQEKLKRNNALDFDDIILNTVKILSANPDVLMKYQERFRYILVDEYQDTNNVQYTLINLIGQAYENICVVGDDDQSIYKFRGANVGNILSFEEDYADTKKIMLEQNYRSTQNILDAANAVIAHNKKRMGKSLWTANSGGDKIQCYTGMNEYEEGRFIASQIKKRYDETGTFADCAVLYRTNAQSRVIEEMLMREAIPYRVLAGLRFYDRKEIKDITAYLRVILNPSDDISLKRIINEPKRKIGAATMDKAQLIADTNRKSVFEVISEAQNYPELKSAQKKLLEFAELINSLIKLKDAIPLRELVARVMNDTGYMAMLTADNSVENQTRIENLNEFMSAVTEYESSPESDGTLAGFLENISLVSEIDAYDEDQDAAVMMTIHSAKGLEFPVVFIAGMEEGLFPGMRSIGSEEDIEEERRLCYVAITRAKERLYVTKTQSRTIYGRTAPSQPSRFFKEIPEEFLEDRSPRLSRAETFVRNVGYEPRHARADKEFYRKPPADIPQADAADFAVGDIVEHRKFGRGTVMSAKQFGKDAILEIDFDSIGHKQLMAAFAKLKRVKE